MATRFRILVSEIPWAEEPAIVGYSPWGRKESDTTSDFTTCTYIYISVYISIQTS